MTLIVFCFLWPLRKKDYSWWANNESNFIFHVSPNRRGSNWTNSTEGYDWNADACGVQAHILGNNGNGITHNVWCTFATPQAALSFLDNYATTPEFAEYSANVSEHRTFLRSHMSYLVKEYNPD